MDKRIILLALLTALGLNLTFANERMPLQEAAEVKATFHPRFKHITIPKEIEIEKKNSVKAIVGDFMLLSPIIKVMINGEGPFNFMFDTGWDQTMIAQHLLKKLKLPLVGHVSGKVKTPTQIVDFVHDRHLINQIKIGNMVLKNYAVDVASAFEDDAQIFSPDVGRIDGVIGPNAFYGLLMSIDYKNQKIHFFKGDLDANATNVVAYAKNYSVPNLPINIKFDKLGKTEKQTFFVDTGNHSFIKVNSCKIPQMHFFKDQDRIASGDFAGNVRTDYLAKLFGEVIFYPGYSIKSPYITFSKNNCNVEPIGLLGRKFFEKHLVTIDHDSSLVKIEPY